MIGSVRKVPLSVTIAADVMEDAKALSKVWDRSLAETVSRLLRMALIEESKKGEVK